MIAASSAARDEQLHELLIRCRELVVREILAHDPAEAARQLVSLLDGARGQEVQFDTAVRSRASSSGTGR